MNRIQTIKFLIAIVSFMLAFNILIYFSQKLEPQQFYSPDGGFSVMIEGTPKEEIQLVNTLIGALPLRAYSSEVGGIAYLVSYTDFPPQYNFNSTNAQKILDSSRDGMASNVFGKVTSERLISINGYPGRYLTIAADNGGAVKAYVYLVKNRMYMLVVATSSSRIYDNSVHNFLDSFKLEGN